MTAPTSFGVWLRQRRKALDLTQDDLAQRVGCSLSAIRKIESDERRPSRQIAELLAGSLEISEEELPIFLKVARGERSVERLSFPPSPLPPPPPLSASSQLSVPTLAPVLSLPSPATPLIGREMELAEITRLLLSDGCRLLTLLGPGGIGKTRLAIQAAAQVFRSGSSQGAEPFFAGVHFVSFAPVTSAEFIIPTISDALSFSFYGHEDPQEQLFSYLREKNLLLVLDNLEQLLPSTAGSPSAVQGPARGVEVLADLLQRAPGVKLLCTSRERLNLQGEWVFEIHGLPVPSASLPSDGSSSGLERYSSIVLFLQSARRVKPGFILTPQNRPYVVRICQLMEGMPLGIELAAAWVRMLACKEIVEEIERSLDFLAVSVRDLPVRHRSLRAAFDHSWNLLSDEERQIFRQLAVFRGGFGREASQKVAQASLPLLSALVDKSLLRRLSNGRYEIHELVRQYAEKKLIEAGEEVETRNRHLVYLLQFNEQAEAGLFGPEQVEWLDRLSEEYNNLRAALEWSQTEPAMAEAGLRLAAALWRFWSVRGFVQEGREWLDRALANPGVVSLPLQARALNGAGLLAWRQGDYNAARSLTEKSCSLWRQLGDRHGLAYAQALMGLVKQHEGDLSTARELIEASVAAFRTEGDPLGLALSLNSLGELARNQGEDVRARELYSEGIKLYRDLGHKRGLADLLHNLAYVAHHQGDDQQAESLFRESLDLELEQGNPRGIAECLLGLAAVLGSRGKFRTAVTLFSAAEAQMGSIGAALEPTDRLEVERNLEGLRACIDRQEFTTAWTTGRSLTPAMAIAFALSEEAGSE